MDRITESITEIRTDALRPHPKNPRHNLGDLSELAAAIREQGVLQNLTVVPGEAPGVYTVVIGHRRLAAAMAAGLETVPCAVAGWDEAEQIAVMMSENICRAALTPLEEAEGVQMMMDLGLAEAEIAERTGLSESTVRRRRKLLSYDREKLEAAINERQVTMHELARLEEIKDEAVRNSLLDSIGTNDFNYKYGAAISRQDMETASNEILEYFKTFAAPMTDEECQNRFNPRSRFQPVISCCLRSKSNIEDALAYRPDHSDMPEYRYMQGPGDWIHLYIKPDDTGLPAQETPEQAARREEDQKRKERVERIKAALETAEKLRGDFVYSGKKIKATDDMLCAAARIISADIEPEALDVLAQTAGFPGFEDMLADSPARALLVILFEDAGAPCPCDFYYGQYNEDGARWLGLIYTLLQSCGYVMSDDELRLLDGTHPLYAGNEGETSGGEDETEENETGGHIDAETENETEAETETDEEASWEEKFAKKKAARSL